MRSLKGVLLLVGGVMMAIHWLNFTAPFLEAGIAGRSQWPTVEGSILAASTHRDEDFFNILTVTFRYEANGIRYEAQQTWPTSSQTLEKYPVGKIVPVYYDPADAARGYVAPKLANPVWMIYAAMLLLGLAAALLGSGVWILVRRK